MKNNNFLNIHIKQINTDILMIKRKLDIDNEQYKSKNLYYNPNINHLNN